MCVHILVQPLEIEPVIYAKVELCVCTTEIQLEMDSKSICQRKVSPNELGCPQVENIETCHR